MQGRTRSALEAPGHEGQGDSECAALTQRAVHGDLATVGLGDGLDDGQAEAGPPRARGVGTIDAIEAVEDAVDVRGRDAVAPVGDDEPDVSGRSGGGTVRGDLDTHGNRGAISAIFHGVVEEVEQELGKAVGIALDDSGCGGGDDDMAIAGDAAHLAGDLLRQRIQAHRLARERRSGVQLGEGQEVADDLVHALDLGLDVGDSLLAIGGVERAAEQLGITADDGEGGAELVRGVGDELAMGGEAALEAIEHAVEGGGEVTQLIPGATMGDALPNVAGMAVMPRMARKRGGIACSTTQGANARP